MKSTSLSVLVFALALLTAQVTFAQEPKDPAVAMTEFLSNSHWTWYEGSFDRYSKSNAKMKNFWVELYKDGTARVPWRGAPQKWMFEPPNKLTVSDGGPNGDKHIFFMDAEKKTGSSENQQLHIHYEKRATKPAGFK